MSTNSSHHHRHHHSHHKHHSYESERERLRKKKLKMVGGICAVVLTFAAVAAGVSFYEHMEQTAGVTASGSRSGQLSTGTGELSNGETDPEKDPAGGEGASGESGDASADAISAARPGARRESLENYIKRLEKLEAIATSFDGVEKCYAIQSGREVRIMVKPDDVSDDGMKVLAREVAKKIEKEMEYPGQIRVNVIRETRATDYAK